MPEGHELDYDLRLVDCPPYHKNISIRRVWSHQIYGKNLITEGEKAVATGELEPPMLILAGLPPMEAAGSALALRKRFQCRVIVDVMDAWPQTLEQALPRIFRGYLTKLILSPYWFRLRQACRSADAVCAQSESFATFAVQNGAAEMPYVCYLGADRIKTEIPDNSDSQVGRQSFLRLVYAGAMGKSYDLETVVRAVEEVNRKGIPVQLVMIGDGEKLSRLKRLAGREVEFTGYLHGADYNRAIGTADIGLVPIFPASGVAVPYKVGDYLAHGLPVISSIDGELGALLRKYSCGSVYPAGNVTALANCIEGYWNRRSELSIERARARICFSQHFDRDTLYPAFARWIKSVCAKELTD